MGPFPFKIIARPVGRQCVRNARSPKREATLEAVVLASYVLRLVEWRGNYGSARSSRVSAAQSVIWLYCNSQQRR